MLTAKERQAAAEIQLSEHFTLLELINSANHPDSVVIPTPAVVEKLMVFAQNELEDFRRVCCENTPAGVDSSYRNPILNKDVGGEDKSAHLIFLPNGVYLGEAADIVPRKVSIYHAFARTTLLKNRLRGFIIYPKRGFIHVDTALKRRTPAWYVSMSKGKYDPVPQAEVPKIQEWLRKKYNFNC